MGSGGKHAGPFFRKPQETVAFHGLSRILERAQMNNVPIPIIRRASAVSRSADYSSHAAAGTPGAATIPMIGERSAQFFLALVVEGGAQTLPPTPFSRATDILAERARIKRQTIEHRRLQHRKIAA